MISVGRRTAARLSAHREARPADSNVRSVRSRIATITSASRSVFPSAGRRSTSSETAPSYPERDQVFQESVDVEDAVPGWEV